MLSLIARWILNAAALLLVAYLYPGVEVVGFGPALIAALGRQQKEFGKRAERLGRFGPRDRLWHIHNALTMSV